MLAGSRMLLSTVRSNLKRSKKVEMKFNDSYELFRVDNEVIQRKEIKNKVRDFFQKLLARKMRRVIESPTSMVNRLRENEIQAPCSQGMLMSQAVTAVQVKIFASDLETYRVHEEGFVEPEMFYTRTFRVGMKTCIDQLRQSCTEFWGYSEGRTMLYIIEEDGTLRDLQFDLASCVTKVVEQYHTQALRCRAHEGYKSKKSRTINYERRLYSGFDEKNDNYKAVFYLAHGRPPIDYKEQKT